MPALRALARPAVLLAAWTALCLGPASAAKPPPAVAILCNDRVARNVVTLLERGRVLVALAPPGTTLYPPQPDRPSRNAAQALFASMRATLVYDAGSRTATAMTAQLYPKTEARTASNAIGRPVLVLTTQVWSKNVAGPVTTATRALRVPARVVGGVVYVPLRAFAEAAGAYVEWNAARRTVVLRTLPPSAQELAAEAEARARIKAIGDRARGSLENAARNLS